MQGPVWQQTIAGIIDSWVKLVLGDVQWRCHRPHPGKEAKKYQVEEAREFLLRAGVES
ncbi:hypothetical protein D3C84_1270500 [compost metagenome]